MHTLKVLRNVATSKMWLTQWLDGISGSFVAIYKVKISLIKNLSLVQVNIHVRVHCYSKVFYMYIHAFTRQLYIHT